MADSTTLTPEESLQQLSDILVSSVLGKDDLSKQNRQLLFGQLSAKVFRDENYVIISVFDAFKDKGITPDESFIKMYLMRNMNFIKRSSEYLDVNAYADLDENPIVGYISAVLKQYIRLKNAEQISHEEYRSVLEKYKLEFSSYEINKAYSQSKLILYDGVQVGKRLYQGYDDSVAYVKKKISDIEALLSHTTGAGFIDSRLAALDTSNRVTPEKIGDFDLIHELNNQLGGIFTSMFYNIMAPTKGGKSKFCTRLIHTIMVKYGHNVSIWAHEGGHEAWWAQLRAIHFEYTYIRNRDASQRVSPLSQAEILFDNYPSADIRALEQASAIDLFTNPSYGNAYMIDRPFLGESFIDEIETSVQLNGSKAILIDYLQLIGTAESGKQKSQVIGRAYQDLLSYCKKRNVAAISPSQFHQTFMNEMASSKDGKAHEVRTAGGESAEIVRTPDINIALYASTEDILRNEMTIMSVPSRFSQPFPDTHIYVDFRSCLFSSVEKEESA